MKNYISILLISMIFLVGCEVTEEVVEDINQQIEDRYSSFSTLKYTITESRYEDGTLTQTQEYTEIFKKPDKIKQIVDVTTTEISQNLLYICNRNTAYSQITPTTMNVYDYINLPSEMDSYCSYFINKGSDKWKIPMEITDKTKYNVETSMDSYGGKDAIKAVVTFLMSEEAKQKQIAIGNTPRERVVTYWFDTEGFAILKEASDSYATECEGSVDIAGGGSKGDCRKIEIRVERVYEEFYFDIDIPDSEFEIDPDIMVKRETVDAGEKFD